MTRIAVALAFATLAAACAGGAQKSSQAAGDASTDLAFEETPAENLSPSGCVMVLWTRASPSKRVFVGRSNPAAATIAMRGKVLEMKRVSQAGETAFGHAQIQTYALKDGSRLVADVRFELAQGRNDGAVVRSASLQYTAKTGEAIVAPVVGLVSCGAEKG